MRLNTARLRVAVAGVIALICLAVSGCGDSPSPAQARAAIRAVLQDHDQAARRGDARAVCAALTPRAQQTHVEIVRHDHPEDNARTCVVATFADMQRNWIDVALLPRIRWTDIQIDGDSAQARGSSGAHTRLMRTNGRWRIDGPQELHDRAQPDVGG